MLLSLIFSLVTLSQADVILGVDRLHELTSQLGQARVALVVNQASLGRFGHTIDHSLTLKLNVKKLFALEHGVRGDADAGEKIPDTLDPISGLPIVSLYGGNRKPTPTMLADIDVIIFDIQDVGVRFYTYISSLGLILQAAKENQKTVVVLDRPNPNAHLVEGPLLKMKHQSFVGMYPIPIVYGLTIGELALMIEGENWLNTKGVDLIFIGMKNYLRNKVEKLTQFPSPNLRSLQAIRAYPWVALFEPTILSVGRGTSDPYSLFGLPDARMGSAKFTPRSDKYKGQVCYGEIFSGLSLEQVPKFTTDYLRNALTRLPNRQVITDPKFLNQLIGDERVVNLVKMGKPYQEIRKSFVNDLNLYDKRRQKYLQY